MNTLQKNGPRHAVISTILLSSALFLATTAQAVPVVLPTDGLVLHLEADSGVTTAMGTTDVTDWADQSAQGNNLTATGAPQLVADAVNGEAAIAFDGVDDTLERLADVMGLPAGDADRTMYLVVNYDSVGYGGAAYGTDGVLNEVFGLIVAPNGNLTVQGWGPANDYISATPGTGAGWLVQSAVHNAGGMTHYLDGAAIDMQTQTYATNPTRIVIGAEIDRIPFVDIDVAAVLIYDRVLTMEEQADVDKYLAVKYRGAVNLAVTAPAEGGTVSSGDVTVTYAAEGTAYSAARFVLDGGTPVDVDAATPENTFTGVMAGPHTVTVTLLDDMGNPVMLADSEVTVNFTAEDCFPDDFAPMCTTDTDGDGTPDSVEGPTADGDGDGIPDYQESGILDSDNDGVANQSDPANNDQCVPNNVGPACVPPAPPSSGGGGSMSLAWMLALSAILVIRRRRFDGIAVK